MIPMMNTDLSRGGMAMKKFYTSLMALATLAMAFSSCTKEVDTQKGEKATGEMKTITVRTGIGTRTTLDSNHENIIWSAGDKLSIFNDVDNANYEADYVAGGDLTVVVPAATEEVYAHYPYYDGNTKGPSEVSVFISNNQTQKNPGELDGFYYPMVAKGTVTADNKAIISLYPVASALALNIYHTGLSGEEKVKNVKVTPAAANTKFTGSQKTDLTGDNIKYTEAGSSNPITVTLTNPLTLGNTKPADKQTFAGQIYVCLAKQSYANVKFEIETTKGVYTITSSDTPFDCVNNDFVPVNINLNKASFSGMTIVDTETADYTTGFESTEGFTAGNSYNNTNLAYFGPQNGNRWDTYYGTVSTNDKLAGSQSMQMRWYASAPGNLGYAETYFYVTKINCISFKAAATNNLKIGLYYKTASAAEWTLAQTYEPSAQAAEYAYYPASVIENAQIRFGIILPDTAPASTSNIRIDDVVISSKATEYSISIASDITHGSVAASATSARAGSTVTLTVTPDTDYILDRLTVKTAGGQDVELTTVTENEEYTIVMPASNVTVSAKFKSTVTPTSGWVKTDISQLSPGDEIVIVDETSRKAMSNNNGTGNPPSAIAVTISDNKITSSVPATIKWIFGSDSEKGYSFNVSGTSTYLYCTNTNNGVRVGTNENRYFHFVSVTGKSQKFLQHVATGRYASYNTANDDWRCYTSVNSNIADSEVAFYKNYGGETPVVSKYVVTLTQPSVAGCSISATVGGTAISSGAEVESGQEVTITATAASGYHFASWTVTGAEVANATSATTTFAVGSSNVAVSASFEANGGSNDTVIEIDFTSSAQKPEGFPNSGNNTSLTTWSIDGYDFSFSASNSYKWMDAYLIIGKKDSYILFPAISGKKLSKVEFTTTSGCSASVVADIYSADGKSTVFGNTAAVGASASKSWTLTGTSYNTQYQFRVTSAHNIQLETLTLTYSE